MAPDNMSNYGFRTQTSVRWIGAAAVCLGTLIIILCIVAHNSSVLNHNDSKWEQLISSLTMDRNTERDELEQRKINSGNQTKEMEVHNSIVLNHMDSKFEQLISNLTMDRNMREELEQMKMNSSNLTEELEVLQSKYNAMAASQDKLQEELIGLRKRVPCLQGWITFQDKCYFFSAGSVSKTWQGSRQDCQTRGADLAIITTQEELDFLSRTRAVSWIGLSDIAQEGKWKWVDGTDLVGVGFWKKGEPNNHRGNEDCVEQSEKKFNDAPCNTEFAWVCER
ncbi:hypothetical protein OYC64_014976 [Pagothenia borchgrevinki]|uniref:C-type lectin domain-containing protein n=1 Tax=Pagothenia borchgrevinki TaxID=8213 RepID=A0ABD2H268_PAGBO